MLPINPTPISSSVNGTLDLFTGIFYVVRILGLGQGLVRPSPTPSPNGGNYLEQDIFENGDPDDAQWFFQESTNPGSYQWSVKSQPKARVYWTAGENETDDFPIELRNLTEVTEGIYEDPTSAFWEFEPYTLENLGMEGLGYKIKPLNLPTGGSATFATSYKSPSGWWLQVNQQDDSVDKDVNRWTADNLFEFVPINFKLYAEVAHMQVDDKNILNILRVNEYLKYSILTNPSPNAITTNLTIQGSILYNVFVQPDTEFDIFSGINVIKPETTPSRIYFDLDNETIASSFDGVLNLRASAYVTNTEEIELEPFSQKNISGYVTYFKEFRGVRYYSYADVTAVIDMMGSDGQVVQNVLVKDVALLKHLIRTRGYRGDFKDVKEEDCAKVQIKIEGTIRGSQPIPLMLFEEGKSTYVPSFEEAYQRKMGNLKHLS